MTTSPMNQAILDVLDERGQMTEPELRQVVFHRIGYDNWTEFAVEKEILIQNGGIGIVPPCGLTPPIIFLRVRTRPVSLIPVEVD